MTEQEIRIAVAEEMGWKWRVNTCGYWYLSLAGTLTKPAHETKLCDDCCEGVPNYPKDLNSIIPLLPPKTIIARHEWGWHIYKEREGCHGKDLALTACEFFLRVKEKWKES